MAAFFLPGAIDFGLDFRKMRLKFGLDFWKIMMGFGFGFGFGFRKIIL